MGQPRNAADFIIRGGCNRNDWSGSNEIEYPGEATRLIELVCRHII